MAGRDLRVTNFHPNLLSVGRRYLSSPITLFAFVSLLFSRLVSHRRRSVSVYVHDTRASSNATTFLIVIGCA